MHFGQARATVLFVTQYPNADLSVGHKHQHRSQLHLGGLKELCKATLDTTEGNILRQSTLEAPKLQIISKCLLTMMNGKEGMVLTGVLNLNF